jgi:SAM-dependent methyltransferase
MLDPTKRFSTRVENYLKYRPGYPSAIIPLLRTECGLTSEAIVADIGSGTGFLSELFLKNGNRVIGIEPNREMRLAGNQILAKYSSFSSMEATAEATTLGDASVDFIAVGQAFHWFDREAARKEFERILKPDGWAVIIWNGIRVEKSPVMSGYQDVQLRYGTDYSDVRRQIADTYVETFFAPGEGKCAHFEFQQFFDLEGFKGRVLSASYAPEPGHPNYEPMLRDLKEVFDANAEDGKVAFDYDTEVYYGQFRAE